MLMLACIPLVIAILSRNVWHGRTQEIVVDLLLLGGFFASLIVAFLTTYILFKLLVITTLMGLCIKWIRNIGSMAAVMFAVWLVGCMWFR